MFIGHVADFTRVPQLYGTCKKHSLCPLCVLSILRGDGVPLVA